LIDLVKLSFPLVSVYVTKKNPKQKAQQHHPSPSLITTTKLEVLMDIYYLIQEKTKTCGNKIMNNKKGEAVGRRKEKIFYVQP